MKTESRIQNPESQIRARAAAFGGLQELGGDTALPPDIQFFPPGRQQFTLMDHPGRTFELDVTPAVAAAANQQLQAMLARAARGEGSLPYADRNHEDGEATFNPTEIFWGGDDAKTGGVRVRTNWTGFGEALVKAKAFRYFSPNFLFDAARKKFLGIDLNIGGLVNRPGFSTIQAFARAGAEVTATPTPKNNMTSEQEAQLQTLQTSVAALTESVTGLTAELTALKAAAKDAPAIPQEVADRLKKLEEKAAAAEAAGTEALKASAKAAVQNAVKAGKLASQDTASQTFWEETIVANAKAVEQLEKLPVNTAFLAVVQAGAKGGEGRDEKPVSSAALWDANRK